MEQITSCGLRAFASGVCGDPDHSWEASNYGLLSGQIASHKQHAAFFASLCLHDLVLARACAEGKALAWGRFLELYREPLNRAAIAMTHSTTLGRDLADALYGELYGLKVRNGERCSPLNSYMGDGTLMGWLRHMLAQRHVDHHRRHYREAQLEDYDAPVQEPEPANPELAVLGKAVKDAIRRRKPEDRYLLKAYYLDDRTQFQIGQILGVHEATISRRIKNLTKDLRKQILRNLQALGLSKQGAQEAIGTDSRDLDLNLSRLLQTSHQSMARGEADR